METLRQRQYPQLSIDRVAYLQSLWGGNPGRLLAEAHSPDNERSHTEAVEAVSLDALRQEAFSWQHSMGVREVWEASGAIPEAAVEVCASSSMHNRREDICISTVSSEAERKGTTVLMS